jgi:hypothetical protein
VKLSYVLLASAIVCAARGLGLIVAPAELFSMYGVQTDIVGLWTAQFLGGVMIGFGLVNYLSRRSTASSTLSAILVGNFVTEFISFIFAAKGAATHIFSSLGWIPAGEHLIFMTAFSYFVFYRKGNP